MINFILAALTGVFIYMKLTVTGVAANWNWFWVLSPVLIPYAIVVCVMLLILLIGLKNVKVTRNFGKIK